MLATCSVIYSCASDCMLSLPSAAACTRCTPRLCSYGCQDFACERCPCMCMQCAAAVDCRTRVWPMQAVEVGITIACIDDRSAQASLVRRPRTLHSPTRPFKIPPVMLVGHARDYRSKEDGSFWVRKTTCWNLGLQARLAGEHGRIQKLRRSHQQRLAARLRSYITAERI